ncbi:hypothetical protein [Rufibacter hautae]|uniref:Uncharacterized protein n=1 Tax=Rufibacter hautae TaxID=2595005 RepID=A0A5B6TEW7_9BACT|nr:hypothetical protein [Rufibacter hautae]KAA3438706.1 hypothetical protein FOA19_15920 [Rufibacter hautae]
MEDLILSVIYALVPLPEAPHGSLVQSSKVQTTLSVGAEELDPHLMSLQEGRLIQVSAHRDYVSLTREGVLRVEWLCRQPLDPRFGPRLPGPGESPA